MLCCTVVKYEHCTALFFDSKIIAFLLYEYEDNRRENLGVTPFTCLEEWVVKWLVAPKICFCQCQFLGHELDNICAETFISLILCLGPHNVRYTWSNCAAKYCTKLLATFHFGASKASPHKAGTEPCPTLRCTSVISKPVLKCSLNFWRISLLEYQKVN